MRTKQGMWTKEWPRRAGWYWFYGVRSNIAKDPGLHMVRVRKASDGFVYIADGTFLYEEEGAKGVFCKAVVPSDYHGKAVNK